MVPLNWQIFQLAIFYWDILCSQEVTFANILTSCKLQSTPLLGIERVVCIESQTYILESFMSKDSVGVDCPWVFDSSIQKFLVSIPEVFVGEFQSRLEVRARGPSQLQVSSVHFLSPVALWLQFSFQKVFVLERDDISELTLSRWVSIKFFLDFQSI